MIRLILMLVATRSRSAALQSWPPVALNKEELSGVEQGGA